MPKFPYFFRNLFTGQGNKTSNPKSGTPPKPQKVDDYVNLLTQHPGTRVTTVRLLGRRATEDNLLLRQPRQRPAGGCIGRQDV